MIFWAVRTLGGLSNIAKECRLGHGKPKVVKTYGKVSKSPDLITSHFTGSGGVARFIIRELTYASERKQQVLTD